MPVSARAEPRSRRSRWLLAAALGVAAALAVGYFGSPSPGDPDRVRELRRELTGDAAKSLPDERRRALAEEMRDEFRRLAPEQRSALFAADLTATKADLEAFFALPPAERVRRLDADIARGERPPSGGPPPTRPTTPRTPPAAEESERRRKAMLDRTTPEQRAAMDQVRVLREKYRDELNRRRQQRGLPPVPPRTRGTT